VNATLSLNQPRISAKKPAAKTAEPPVPNYASDEINAYLALRNLILSEAEEAPTDANLHRAWTANEFVEKCLRPARSPYQGQCLPDADSVRERQRCNAVKVRIAELRTRCAPHFSVGCRAA
jgi:hypothetical protein